MLKPERILDICGDHPFRGFYVGEHIPEQKLRAVRELLALPEWESVLAFYDSTVFKNGKAGLALCLEGIHWKNPYWVEEVAGAPTHVPWDFLHACDIAIDDKRNVVTLGDGMKIGAPADDRERVSNLLVALQMAAIDERRTKNGSTRPDIPELLRVCEEFAGRPGFRVRPWISQALLESVRERLDMDRHEPVLLVWEPPVGGGPALAVADFGVYLRDAATPGRTEIAWRELADGERPAIRGDGAVELAGGAVFHGAASQSDVLALLEKVWEWERTRRAWVEPERVEAPAPPPLPLAAILPPPPPPPAPPRPMDEARILEICQDHTFRDFRVEPGIPEKKVRNARKHFPIPEHERVLALFDATVFGSNDNGMAVCTSGLYWKNGVADRSAEHYLSWAALRTARVGVDEKKNQVTLGFGNYILVVGKDVHHGADLVRALQDAARETAPPPDPEADNRPGLDELRRLCGEHSAETPIFLVGSRITERKVAELRENFGVLPSDEVLLLYDKSGFGKLDYGLAITASGVYWRNLSSDADGHRRSPVTWPELAAGPHPSRGDKNVVEIAPDAWFHVGTLGAGDARDQVLFLLQRVRYWARDALGLNEPAPPPIPFAGLAPPPPPPPGAPADDAAVPAASAPPPPPGPAGRTVDF